MAVNYSFLFQSGAGGGGGSNVGGGTQISQFIGMTQATAANLTSMVINGTSYLTGTLWYQIVRSNTAATQIGEVGELVMFFDPIGSAWALSREIKGTFGSTQLAPSGAGVSFQITGAGQVQYTSALWTGAGYTGYIKWEFMQLLRVNT